MSLCRGFSSSLVSAVDEFMLGKHGRPLTLVETLTWMSNQLVNPTHRIGKSLEVACQQCKNPQNCFLGLLKKPAELKAELEELLSPGIVTYSTSIENALLGRLPWSQIPLEFMIVWILGRNRWVVESAKPVDVHGFKRTVFKVRNPVGSPLILVSSSGETDAEAEEQGKKALEEFEQLSDDRVPTYIVTLSKENESTEKDRKPRIIRLHRLQSLLVERA